MKLLKHGYIPGTGDFATNREQGHFWVNALVPQRLPERYRARAKR